MTSFSSPKLCVSFKPLGVDACLTTIIKINEMKQRQSASDQLHCLELWSQLKFDTQVLDTAGWRDENSLTLMTLALSCRREHNLPLNIRLIPQSSNINWISHRYSVNLINPDTKSSETSFQHFFPTAFRNPLAVIQLNSDRVWSGNLTARSTLDFRQFYPHRS